jgi:hypothetical protein
MPVDFRRERRYGDHIMLGMALTHWTGQKPERAQGSRLEKPGRSMERSTRRPSGMKVKPEGPATDLHATADTFFR